MLAEFVRVVGFDVPPKILFSKLQLWGAGIPLNTAGADCLIDVSAQVGVCGDWCIEPSVQAVVSASAVVVSGM